ncbi:phosphate acetyltransferase [Halobacteroides halobius DSM 5150]|uniref:Phosphate acetyltransferase n=1 Tax=Halobacteroides halobius (strain ATCC 35273 / DSM 5150 / MD-1) TaxID=748449 RepID=L0K7Y2_HALHC|nr:phosphate acetyltransferase [Halobacteroides halobius]AGB41372.1 phosphate acetyltransferase [Halobacteroides halobius DSM 5150]
MSFIKRMHAQARDGKEKIVLPEGTEPRMIKAVPLIIEKGIAEVVLLGDKQEVQDIALEHGVDLSGAEIINPVKSDKLEEYAQVYYKLRKHKGITKEEAQEKIKEPLYFGAMMVKQEDADGQVAGAANPTGNVLRSAIKIIGTAEGISVISGAFVMIVQDKDFGDDGLLLFGDCAVNPNPDTNQLAEIAVSTAKTAQDLANIDPKVGMLSFSTNGSAQHDLVNKVQEATDKAQEINPDLKIDGEMQSDAALVPKVADKKYPESEIAGNANVLVFPDLQAGNIGYKLVQRLAGAEAIGPILQGVAKPVNDLSRGCNVQDIVNVVAITVVQAQNC